jgi:geranylgeranyl transferase type-2 subunit beta
VTTVPGSAANYLLELTSQLGAGVERVPADLRARHVAYLRAAQNPDGGFSGREGGSDLYYTGFALRGLAVLDALTPALCSRAAGFLRGSLTTQASVIDLFSLLYSCLLVQAGGGPEVLPGSLSGERGEWPARVAATLDTLRKPDGGYAKTAAGVSGSTYHTFLVVLCYQLLGELPPRTEEVIRFLHTRRREDGGFVEVAPMRRSGTNPTAAAVGALQALGDSSLVDEVRGLVIDFLAGMASEEGGLRANARAPLADLLSSFTGAWTLHRLGAADRIDADAVLRYVQLLELSGGGFHGGLWDAETDVEYTFYGLGCLALLANQEVST